MNNEELIVCEGLYSIEELNFFIEAYNVAVDNLYAKYAEHTNINIKDSGVCCIRIVVNLSTPIKSEVDGKNVLLVESIEMLRVGIVK